MTSPVDISGLHAFAFGSTPQMADSLLALVIGGAKTATCDSRRRAEASGDPLPEPGRRDVVLDGAGRPRAVIETVKVEFFRFEDVPEEYAVNAGEGWSTIEEWREAYGGYLKRHGGFEPGMEMICERFRLVEVLPDNETAER